MSKKRAFIFPGQGAQYVGMGKDFYDKYSTAKQIYDQADDLLSLHLSKLIFNGPGEELTLTKNSQIAIYVTSIAILKVISEEFPDLTPSICAGLSLGEYSALTAAKKLTFADGVALVRARGEFMNEASEKYPGTMAVVLGFPVEGVQECLKDFQDQVWVANLNCPGQVVISGTVEGVELASKVIKEKGAKRVLPLDVSGAFHSGLMREAQEKLSQKLNEVPIQESAIEIVMNVPGEFVVDALEMRKNLLNQVTSPVRWEKGVRAMMERHTELYVEIGCGKTLSGMNKKIGATGTTVNVNKMEDLENLTKALESNTVGI